MTAAQSGVHMNAELPFRRHAGNPIIQADQLPGAHAISNSAVVRLGRAYAGVFRVDHTDRTHRLHAGRSIDGLRWEIDPSPIAWKSSSPDQGVSNYTFDPRITPLDGRYYITFCDPGKRGGPYVSMGYTKHFESFVLLEDPLPPANRNAVLFPEKVRGEYALLHRPSDKTHTAFGEIFYSASPDLTYWGKHRFVMGPEANWESTKIGPGPAPVAIAEGWLMIYHGVWTSCNGFLYSVGGAILDREQPWKVIARSRRYLLAPSEPYERAGDVPNVVFPTALVVQDDGDTAQLYYGCADTCISAAETSLRALTDYILAHSG